MIVTYDPDVDAAYIQLAAEILTGGVAKTYPCDPREIGGVINLDFDLNGRLVGIEITDASRLLPPESLPGPTAS
jgi:uncharacterized protein YuzE